MSIIAIAQAAKVKTLDTTTKFVLIALSNYANDENEAWPKQTTIAEFCAIARETVCKHLSILEEKGYIKSETRRYKDGRNASKIYNLLFVNNSVSENHTDERQCDGESHGQCEPESLSPCDGGSQQEPLTKNLELKNHYYSLDTQQTLKDSEPSEKPLELERSFDNNNFLKRFSSFFGFTPDFVQGLLKQNPKRKRWAELRKHEYEEALANAEKANDVRSSAIIKELDRLSKITGQQNEIYSGGALENGTRHKTASEVMAEYEARKLEEESRPPTEYEQMLSSMTPKQFEAWNKKQTPFKQRINQAAYERLHPAEEVNDEDMDFLFDDRIIRLGKGVAA